MAPCDPVASKTTPGPIPALRNTLLHLVLASCREAVRTSEVSHEVPKSRGKLPPLVPRPDTPRLEVNPTEGRQRNTDLGNTKPIHDLSCAHCFTSLAKWNGNIIQPETAQITISGDCST